MARIDVSINADLHILLIMSDNPLEAAEGKTFNHMVTVFGRDTTTGEHFPKENLVATTTTANGITTGTVHNDNGLVSFNDIIEDIADVDATKNILRELAIDIILERDSYRS